MKKTEAQKRSGKQAFTLVELLVAITAGLFVAVGAFALAKQGSRFFQQEARVANAQFSAALGFDRLRADIARAGFLSTANIQRDPFYCGPRPSGAPAGITALAAMRIVKGAPAEAQDTANQLAPDQIWLAGSYSSPETFPVRSIFQNGAAFNVYLQPNNGATARAGGAEGGTLAQIFTAGRMLRILDSTGRYEFGEIQGYSIDAAGEMVITLKQVPAIAFKRDAGSTCGVEGFGVGMQANVVNWIKYEIRNLKANIPAGYQPLYSEAGTAPGDETRLDLVRVEVAADESELAVELVAEYAVDLKFGLTVASDIANGTDPTTSVFPIGDDRNYEYTYKVAPPAPADQKGPERIRSVRARFAVRSREADRTGDIAAPTGNIFRYSFGSDAGYARTRTLTADISLPNLANLKW